MRHADYLSLKENEDTTYTFVVKEEHLNEHETVHGGVLYSICSEAVALYVDHIEKRVGVGAEGSIHYYRAAKLNEELTIHVIPRKSGKRMSIYLIEVWNDNKKLIADVMFTVAHPA